MSEIEGQPQPRRSFTEEFKRDAVRLATERGNVSAVARDRSINESVLNRWKRQLQQEPPKEAGSRILPMARARRAGVCSLFVYRLSALSRLSRAAP